jgi:2-polyprenyl-3-methyl-5-hydroxy-6-metoxy-1,4-benzoquinol methylase
MAGHVPNLWIRDKPSLQTDFLVRERLLPIIGKVKGLNILDVGCGEGYLSRKFAKAGALVEAFDNDAKMIKIAKKAGSVRGKMHYANLDLSNISHYPKNSFDLVIASGVICFLNEISLSKFFKETFSLLKNGGRLVIATNHTDSYFKKAKSNWIIYKSQPDASKGTQEVELDFRDSKNQNIFSGRCFFHTKKTVIEKLRINHFKEIKSFDLLLLEEERANFCHMWIDEGRIPFHLITIAEK